MVQIRARAAATVAVVLAAAIGVAACGSSSSSSSTSSATSSASAAGSSSAASSSAAPASTTFTPTGSGGLALIGSGGSQAAESNDPLGIKAQTGTSAQKEAMAAADADAAKISSATVPKGTSIGLQEIINSVPSAQRADGQLIYALRELGFNVIPCDGAGDPGKIAACMTSLVNQGVKGIISLGTDPSLVAQGLQAAKAKNIPVMSFSGAVAPSPLWTRVYYNDDKKAGKVLGDYVVQQLKAHSGKSVWVSNYPASWAAERTQGLVSAAAGTDIKVGPITTVDSTNPIAGTQQQVITQYTQDPTTPAYWFAYDAPGAAGAQALASKTGGKPFPAGPLVVTFHADQQANDLIRKGQITAVVDEDYDASSFEAADAMAQYMAKKTVPPSDTGAGYNGHQMYYYPVITKTNLPPAGKWPEPAFDVVSYFSELWHKEFGLNP
jgi:ABC-type sugar transport system substrate-binding protein